MSCTMDRRLSSMKRLLSIEVEKEIQDQDEK